MTDHVASPALVTRLLRWMHTDRNDIRLVILYAVASSIVGLAIPVTVQAMVNTIAFGVVVQPIVVLSLLVFFGLALASFFRALQARLVELLQQRIFARAALQLSRRLPSVDAKIFDDSHGPEIANRFFDVMTVQKATASLLVDGSALLLQTLVGMIVLAFYHPYLLAFDVLMVAAMAVVLVYLGRGAEGTAIVESKYKYKMAAWLQEMLRHPVLFKGPGGEAFAAHRTYELTQSYLTARRAHFTVLFRQIVGALFLQVVFSSILIGIGGFLVMQKQLTLGQLVAAEIIVSGVLAGFSKIGKQLESLYDMLAGYGKLEHLLELPPEQAGRGGFPAEALGPASVAVKEVDFKLGKRQLLDAADLEVRAGERIALLGPNGAGKSSLLNLLYGLRKPDSGILEVDGETLHTLSATALRQHVAMVRGVEIFEGTVMDNITAGRKEFSVEQVRQVLVNVGLWDDVKLWPQGLDTQLGAYGARLSMGQARKLVLARAVIERPRLLLLDESLDELDAASRDVVTEFLFAPHQPWTVLLTTHDPDLVQRCSRAVRLENQKFVEVPVRKNTRGAR